MITEQPKFKGDVFIKQLSDELSRSFPNKNNGAFDQKFVLEGIKNAVSDIDDDLELATMKISLSGYYYLGYLLIPKVVRNVKDLFYNQKKLKIKEEYEVEMEYGEMWKFEVCDRDTIPYPIYAVSVPLPEIFEDFRKKISFCYKIFPMPRYDKYIHDADWGNNEEDGGDLPS